MDLIFVILLLHFILCLFFFIFRTVTGQFRIMSPFVVLIMPIFGPLAGSILIFDTFRNRHVDYEKNFAMLTGAEKSPVFDFRRMTGDFVSAEEVFIVNSNSDRRKIMLDILRQDAKPYLDVLKLAVSNDDAETSHYATATIMQIQTDYQNDIANCFAKASDPEATEEDLKRYIASLLRYINSKLLDENLLVRQRLALKGAIEIAVKKYHCMEYATDYVDNLIRMGEIDMAQKALQPLLSVPYPSEEAILLRGRLFIKAKDRKGLDAFINELRQKHVTLTPMVQEEMSFWEGQRSSENG